jgi:hypothetical protein
MSLSASPRFSLRYSLAVWSHTARSISREKTRISSKYICLNPGAVSWR